MKNNFLEFSFIKKLKSVHLVLLQIPDYRFLLASLTLTFSQQTFALVWLFRSSLKLEVYLQFSQLPYQINYK
jgi:hypothetical protein